MTKIASDISNGASRAVEFTGEVINDLVNVVLRAAGGVVDGANLIANTTGSAADKLAGDVIGVQTTQIFKDVGAIAGDIADGLGTVVGEVPLVGKPAALIVRRAGDGVYHVIASVGSAAGSGATRLGKIAKKTTDLVVFTLSSGREELDEIGNSVTTLVTKLTERRGGKRRSRRSRRRSAPRISRTSRRSKSRGGLALTAPNMDQGAPFHPVWKTEGGRRSTSRRRTARRKKRGGGTDGKRNNDNNDESNDDNTENNINVDNADKKCGGAPEQPAPPGGSGGSGSSGSNSSSSGSSSSSSSSGNGNNDDTNNENNNNTPPPPPSLRRQRRENRGRFPSTRKDEKGKR